MPDLVYELARYLTSKEVLWILVANGNSCVPTTIHYLLKELTVKSLKIYLSTQICICAHLS